MTTTSQRHAGAFLSACLAIAGLLPVTGFAQDALPAPKEFYFDADAMTTRPVQARGGGNADQLVTLMERGGRDARAAAAQLAAIAYRDGRNDLGESLYARALSGGTQVAGHSTVLWNQGWDRYRAGDVAGALDAWRRAGTGRPGAPAWVPPTFALALWSLDRRDEAVRWYAAAVRTEPALWADAARLATLLPDWREEDRARLADVVAAWRAAPPAAP